jgi:cell division septation protein DedD
MPEEAGDPAGPWVNSIAEVPPPRTEVPAPEVLVRVPEEAGEPQGPWVDPIADAPKPSPAPEAPRVTVITPAETRADTPPVPAQPGAYPSGEFSVPVNVITELEKGKYYVQLGAYRNAASIESALLKIDPGYPLKVQPSGSADNPLYRLLVGPVNLGESGALVQRFKGSGYRDAYVRSN